MKSKKIGVIELMKNKNINWNDELVKSIHAFLKTLKKEPIKITKNLIFDESSSQFSINIPKNIVIKSNMKKNTELSMVFNPDKKIREEIDESKFVIYLKNEE